MMYTFRVVFSFLVSIHMSSVIGFSRSIPYIKDEFDISSLWHEGMTWEEFRAIRNSLQHPGLSTYVDKIEQQKMALRAGIEVPRTYVASRRKVPVQKIVSELSSYVAKCTHLSLSKGLVIVKDGVDLFSLTPRTPQGVENHVYGCLESRPRDVESWALHQVKPGFMIQEYIPNRNEAKILTIWGRAMIGEWRAGEVQKHISPLVGKYDRRGNPKEGNHPAPFWWSKAVKAAEIMAKGTDALRVDFLVREDGTILLNEMEIWCECDWKMMLPKIEARLNEGYRRLCKDL